MKERKFNTVSTGPFEKNEYSEIIPTGFMSWINECPNILAFQIINNIRTVHYNYDYGCHQEISLLSILLFDRSPISRSIDRVLGSIDITPIDKKELDKEYEYVCDKKSLAKLILLGHRKIIVVNPKSSRLSRKDKAIEDSEFYNFMKSYLSVISRYIRIRSTKLVNNLMMSVIETK